MNKELLEKLKFQAAAQVSPLLEGNEWQQVYSEKFAELIVRECMTIAKTWEDQLEKAKQLSESNAVGIVAYRIARQFGVKE